MATSVMILGTIWVIVSWTGIISLCYDDGEAVLMKAVFLKNFRGCIVHKS